MPVYVISFSLKDLLEKRLEGIQEQIRDWEKSLPSTEAKLLECTASYLARHPQPTASFPPVKPITFQCHKEFKDRFKYYCASKNANHLVTYYDSGDFTFLCPYCNAELLKSEREALDLHRWGKCCAYGDVNTDIMKLEYADLTKNAPDGMEFITLGNEKSERENFLENTLPLNNEFAFGSIKCGKVRFSSKFSSISYLINYNIGTKRRKI